MKEILRDFLSDIPAVTISFIMVYLARRDLTQVFNIICVWIGIFYITLCGVSFAKRIIEEIVKK